MQQFNRYRKLVKKEEKLNCLTLNNFILYMQQFNTYYKTTETCERTTKKKRALKMKKKKKKNHLSVAGIVLSRKIGHFLRQQTDIKSMRRKAPQL